MIRQLERIGLRLGHPEYFWGGGYVDLMLHLSEIPPNIGERGFCERGVWTSEIGGVRRRELPGLSAEIMAAIVQVGEALHCERIEYTITHDWVREKEISWISLTYKVPENLSEIVRKPNGQPYSGSMSELAKIWLVKKLQEASTGEHPLLVPPQY